jgi:hypothetical protein
MVKVDIPIERDQIHLIPLGNFFENFEFGGGVVLLLWA